MDSLIDRDSIKEDDVEEKRRLSLSTTQGRLQFPYKITLNKDKRYTYDLSGYKLSLDNLAYPVRKFLMMIMNDIGLPEDDDLRSIFNNIISEKGFDLLPSLPLMIRGKYSGIYTVDFGYNITGPLTLVGDYSVAHGIFYKTPSVEGDFLYEISEYNMGTLVRTKFYTYFKYDDQYHILLDVTYHYGYIKSVVVHSLYIGVISTYNIKNLGNFNKIECNLRDEIIRITEYSIEYNETYKLGIQFFDYPLDLLYNIPFSLDNISVTLQKHDEPYNKYYDIISNLRYANVVGIKDIFQIILEYANLSPYIDNMIMIRNILRDRPEFRNEIDRINITLKEIYG